MHFAVKRSVGILSSVTSSPRAESVFILVAVVLELIPPTGMNTGSESITQGHHRALWDNSDEGTGWRM